MCCADYNCAHRMAVTSGTTLGRFEIQSPGVMARVTKIAPVVLTVLLWGTTLAGQQQGPFPVTSVVDEPTIAGHPVQLDEQGKLLPWPMPHDIGYSYSSHFLTQWTILWDQHNRQRLHYFYCCFDFDRHSYLRRSKVAHAKRR
jgi:hypothetical protein